MIFHFRAYELNFESVLEPPSQLCITKQVNPIDVRIYLGKVTDKLALPVIVNDYYQVSSREFLLTIPNVARYSVTNGNVVVIEPFPNADLDKVRLFLFGSALGALLYQRSLFPLHGSAVVTKFGVMIFVGPQGVGKSTLAAHFQKRGYTLLSDDVCVITTDSDNILQVLPAFPQIRLCPDAHVRLKLDKTPSSHSRFDVDKFVVSLPSGHCIQTTQLCAVHLLTEHERIEIINKPVQGFERVNILMENLYRPGYLRGFETMGDIMQRAAYIAKHAFVSQILRPRDSTRIEELIDWLINEWDSNQNYHQKGESVR